MYIKRYKTKKKNIDNPYWMSFSDMMAGILIIFILACTTLLLKLSQMEEQVKQNIDDLKNVNKKRVEIVKDIKDYLAKNNIEVIVSDNDTVIRIPESSFHFETNLYSISDELKPTARLIGYALYNAISKEERWKALETVFIEGHSDSRDTDFKLGNWGLSASRAIFLWDFWTKDSDYGIQLKELKNYNGKYLFSVSGYAATRRVSEEEKTEEQMRKNRRIDIRFTTRQPTIMEIQEVIKPLKK